MSSLKPIPRLSTCFIDQRRKHTGDVRAPVHPAQPGDGFLGLVPALIIYLRTRSLRYVAYQSLQAVVFQLVYFFGAAIWQVSSPWSPHRWFWFASVFFGLLIALLLALIPLGALIYGIVGAVETYHGRDFQYWLVGQWVRKTDECC